MEDYVVDYILTAIQHVVEYGTSYLPEYRYDPKKNNWNHQHFKRTFPPLDIDHLVPETMRELTPDLLVQQQKQVSIPVLTTPISRGKLVYRFTTEKKK